jgi:hypothetical protein
MRASASARPGSLNGCGRRVSYMLTPKGHPEIKVPFEVPEHKSMLLRVRGKQGTVVCIEVQLFNCVIREYTEPLSWRREWTYEHARAAVAAMIEYVAVEALDEPNGWIRAVDVVNDRVRIRRARLEFGERVIVVDDGLDDPWA